MSSLPLQYNYPHHWNYRNRMGLPLCKYQPKVCLFSNNSRRPSKLRWELPSKRWWLRKKKPSNLNRRQPHRQEGYSRVRTPSQSSCLSLRLFLLHHSHLRFKSHRSTLMRRQIPTCSHRQIQPMHHPTILISKGKSSICSMLPTETYLNLGTKGHRTPRIK